MAQTNRGVTTRTPSSLLRNKYVDITPTSSTAANSARVFTGPALIKHIYFLTQQDMNLFAISTAGNRDEIKMSLYDSADATVANLPNTPTYEQVVPQGIPDGVLQELFDELVGKYNAMRGYIDDNVIGAKSDCGNHGSGNGGRPSSGESGAEASYTGSLADECGTAGTSLTNCRKLNKMICMVNWGLDYIGDRIAGRFHLADDANDAGACAGSTGSTDVSVEETDYRGNTLIANCGTGLPGSDNHRANCTKINKLICYLNHSLVSLDDAIIGPHTSCLQNQYIAPWRGENSYTIADMCGNGSGSGSANQCTKLNYFRCVLMAYLARVGFSTGDSIFSIDFSWWLLSSEIDALTDYSEWTVPLKPYLSQDWAPRLSYRGQHGGSNSAATTMDFDNYNRNQGFQITFPEPGLYVANGLVVKQNSDNASPAGSMAPTHTNVIYQQTTTGIDAKTGAIIA